MRRNRELKGKIPVQCDLLDGHSTDELIVRRLYVDWWDLVAGLAYQVFKYTIGPSVP